MNVLLKLENYIWFFALVMIKTNVECDFLYFNATNLESLIRIFKGCKVHQYYGLVVQRINLKSIFMLVLYKTEVESVVRNFRNYKKH